MWQALAALRADPGLDAVTCDWDWGIGVVRRRPNTDVIALPDPLTWADYAAHWRRYLRPCTMVEFDAWLRDPD